jgi:hypothetical protein
MLDAAVDTSTDWTISDEPREPPWKYEVPCAPVVVVFAALEEL